MSLVYMCRMYKRYALQQHWCKQNLYPKPQLWKMRWPRKKLCLPVGTKTLHLRLWLSKSISPNLPKMYLCVKIWRRSMCWKRDKYWRLTYFQSRLFREIDLFHKNFVNVLDLVDNKINFIKDSLQTSITFLVLMSLLISRKNFSFIIRCSLYSKCGQK